MMNIRMYSTVVVLIATLLSPMVMAESADDGFEWSRATLELIASGDAKRGEKLARKKKCQNCHGDEGISDEEDTPSIAGQVAAYHFKQLLDYKTGVRSSRTMRKYAKKLSQQEMADIAAYYSTLEPLEVEARDMPHLVAVGDKGRFLIACSVCHSSHGKPLIAKYQVPDLNGQRAVYIMDTMTAFREGDRENDKFGRMRYIAKQLTEDEIEEIAAYYGTEVEEEEDDDDEDEVE